MYQQIEKGFWRGRPCVQARTDAAQLSKKHPDVLDLAVTKNHFNYFPDEVWKARLCTWAGSARVCFGGKGRHMKRFFLNISLLTRQGNSELVVHYMYVI